MYKNFVKYAKRYCRVTVGYGGGPERQMYTYAQKGLTGLCQENYYANSANL